MSKIKIALVQFEAKLCKCKENTDRAVKLAEEAAKNGAKFICFPEMFNTGYNLNVINRKIYDFAETLDGYTVSKFKIFAKEHEVYVIVPIAIEVLPSVIENSAVLINNKGEVQNVYSKSHLWSLESVYFKSGDDISVFDTDYGKIGIMICYDAGFPEVARMLTLQGAKIIFMPAAWRIQDKDMWDLNVSGRALENTVFIAAVNRFGHEEDLYLFGNSKVANPRGTIIAESTNEAEEIVYCEIDLDEVQKHREVIPYLKDRQSYKYDKIFRK